MSLLAGRSVETIRRAIARCDDPTVLAALRRELEDEKERLDRTYAERALDNEDDWRLWLPQLFPTTFSSDFAPHHAEVWDWIWSIELAVRPSPQALVAVWDRGGGKSTVLETAIAALGARRRRKVVLYVCDTQGQADDHVGAIGSRLESRRIALAYPELGERLVGKFGESKGWRRNRLRTAAGFTVDALGLDSAARGFKIEDDRPDLIVFDDIDDSGDGPSVTDRKIENITQKLLPAGSDALAVVGVQNVPNPHGVFARLAGLSDMPADFLRDRILSGPIPRVYDPTYEQTADGGWVLIDGRPSWPSESWLDRANSDIATWGISAFRLEAQHDVDARSGGMFADVAFVHCQRSEVPDLYRKVCWVDPAVTETDHSDAHGIQIDGYSDAGTVYRLRSWERRATPVETLKLALVWAAIEGCPYIGIETDQGGDTWGSVFREARADVERDLEQLRRDEPIDGTSDYLTALAELAGYDPTTDYRPLPEYHLEEKASRVQLSKASRAQQMLADYEIGGRIVHVLGTHLILERALRRFGRTKPFDLVDAAYWGWHDLRAAGPTEAYVPVGTLPKAHRRNFG